MATKKPKLTVKEAKLVKGVASGMPKYKAAIAAGYSPKSAPQIADETLKKPNVQEALQAELARQGITIEQIVAPVAKGLKAKRIVEVEGDFFETEVDDLDKQFKAHDRAMKILGVSFGDGGTTNNFIQIINDQRDKYGI